MKNPFKRLTQKLNKLIQLFAIGKRYYFNESVIWPKFDSYRVNYKSFTLDIGSGPSPKNPFKADNIYGVDLRINQENNVVCADISSDKLPFADNTFDYLTAYDVLEHIQRVSVINGETRFPFICLMNEIFRVLKKDGIFFSMQPCYPVKEAFQDPTHVNIMTEDTIYLYFCEPAWARIYGFEGSFIMMDDGWVGGKYFSFIKKSQDAPVNDLNFIQK